MYASNLRLRSQWSIQQTRPQLDSGLRRDVWDIPSFRGKYLPQATAKKADENRKLVQEVSIL
jgi:hypothetical protein